MVETIISEPEIERRKNRSMAVPKTKAIKKEK
jgi:hypothetical protein